MDKYIELLFEGESKQAQKLMRSMIPDKLYKFVPLTEDEVLNESKFDCIEHNTFFFSTVKKVNDPYEFKGIYLAEEDLINIGWPESEAKRILSSYDPDAWFAIGCFTGNDEHFLPMWAYYTNNYRGYCVEYNVDDPTQIYKVLYDTERSPGALAVSGLLYAHREEMEQEAEYIQSLLKTALFTKHMSWKWENEYRILNPLSDPTSPGSKVELSKVGLSTARVIAGINCKPEHQERLHAICRDHSFVFSRASVSKTSFGFDEV